MNTPKATIDFESRSACSLRACGSWRYSLHPTTEVLCLAFRLPHWDAGRTGLWHPAFPHLGIPESPFDADLAELLDWIADGGLVEAHNAWFERGIWTNILVPRHGFEPIRHTQWRCSAAKAATHALPRNLEDATKALRLHIQKDMEGAKVMKKVMQPRKALKKERTAWAIQHAPCECCEGKGKFKVGRAKAFKCEICAGQGWLGDVPPMPLLYHESAELFERLWQYCRVDVLAEEELSARIPDLDPQETQYFLLDQQINERGFELDPESVDAALELIDLECTELNAELKILTEGFVEKATQRERMMVWFESEGLDLPNTQKATIDEILEDMDETTIASPAARRGLELVRTLGRSSTAKYSTMQSWICPDNRVRGGLLFHGATTGRWSGKGVQPHNFTKGTIKDITKFPGDAWEVLKTRDRGFITAAYGDVMEALSDALRGVIVAAPGMQLYVADYAAIEARVVLWLADDQDALGIFLRHEDIYKDMAADIYNIPMSEVSGDQRQHGKQAVLGCGYQMGWTKFQATCAKFGIIIDEEMAQRIVQAYRAKYYRVVNMWRDQEDAALQALRSRRPVDCGYVTWEAAKDFLYCTLPSGRRLAYPFPEIRAKETPWGTPKASLTYVGVNSYTRKWTRQTSYGGMLVENITQAVARDLMACAMQRCEESGIYVPVLSVHDEMIAEAPIGTGDVKQFEKLMATCPDWAEGCPVEAEGWTGLRYRK
jgi:DNA polymerase